MAYNIIILVSWVTFLAVWAVGAIGAKPDVRQRTGNFWLWRALLIILVVMLGGHLGGVDYASKLSFQTSITFGWVGAVLTVLGLAIAIWARVYLGRNWSSHPTQKAEHELVTGGPYKYVRHPIYTGVILALFGTMFIGSLYSIIAFVVLTLMFILRIPREERIMLGLFPDQYPAYQKRTKRLIPWIW